MIRIPDTTLWLESRCSSAASAVSPHSICSICALEYMTRALSEADACMEAWDLLISKAAQGQVKGFEFCCRSLFCAGCQGGCSALHRHLLFIGKKEGLPLWAVDHVLYWNKSELWYRMRDASHAAWVQEEKARWEKAREEKARELKAMIAQELEAIPVPRIARDLKAKKSVSFNPVLKEVELDDKEISL